MTLTAHRGPLAVLALLLLLSGLPGPIRLTGDHAGCTDRANQRIRPLGGAHAVAGVHPRHAAVRHHRRAVRAGLSPVRASTSVKLTTWPPAGGLTFSL